MISLAAFLCLVSEVTFIGKMCGVTILSHQSSEQHEQLDKFWHLKDHEN